MARVAHCPCAAADRPHHRASSTPTVTRTVERPGTVPHPGNGGGEYSDRGQHRGGGKCGNGGERGGGGLRGHRGERGGGGQCGHCWQCGGCGQRSDRRQRGRGGECGNGRERRCALERTHVLRCADPCLCGHARLYPVHTVRRLHRVRRLRRLCGLHRLRGPAWRSGHARRRPSGSSLTGDVGQLPDAAADDLPSMIVL